ncbi:MAG TPA: hypothetical protein VL282_15710 [Tepidisphaeraceae bacterium]|jgi:hypothetical protein|nr:hypothetical protein [Tepidisphaeraceae bacterium]
MSLKASITVDPSTETDGSPSYRIKIQTDTFELNVCVRPEEVVKFDRVFTTPWSKGAIQIGTSAGSRAFWCSGDEAEKTVSILIGHDDQTWDFAVSLPRDSVDAIRREIDACR